MGATLPAVQVYHLMDISIHAPREGGDNKFGKLSRVIVISIHAPREGGDSTIWLDTDRAKHFNPRPPRGGRLITSIKAVGVNIISIHAPREGGDYLSLLCGW